MILALVPIRNRSKLENEVCSQLLHRHIEMNALNEKKLINQCEAKISFIAISWKTELVFSFRFGKIFRSYE